MTRKIKVWWHQMRCNHINADLVRWHLVHYPENDPIAVEAEYICGDCGKLIYIYLRGSEVAEWVECMKDYKRY